MKLLSYFVGLLIVGVVVVPTTVADISLKLRQQKQYIPPAESSQNDEQKFEESRYGNSQYQVFEVHNHFDIPAGDSVGANSVSTRTEEIHIEHINPPPGFPLDDPNLDATLLKVATEDNGSEQHQSTIVNEISQSSTQSTQENIPIPFPSNYRHDFSKKPTPKPTEFVEVVHTYPSGSSSISESIDSSASIDFVAPVESSLSGAQSQSHFRHQASGNSFKGPDYLPPNGEGRSIESSGYHAPGYLPPQQGSNPQSNPFKGNPYLPPVGGSNGGTSSSSFKGPDYLPPVGGSNGGQSSNNFKGPDYLPPQGGASGQQQSSGGSNSFRGPDYLPPQQTAGSSHVSHNGGSSNPSSFRGPDYLPPQHNGAASQVSQSNGNSGSNNPFKGPDYLPPQQGSTSQQGSFETSSSFKAPGYLPPQSQETAQTLPRSNSNAFKGPDYLPPQENHGKHHQQQQVHQHHQVSQNQHHQQAAQIEVNEAPGSLPPGYDFEKPYNAEEAIAELHTLPEQSPTTEHHQEVSVSSQIHVGGGQTSSNVVYGSSTHENGPQGPGSSYQAPGYLPPSGHNGRGQELSNGIESRSNHVSGTGGAFQAPGYLPPSHGITSGQVSQQTTGGSVSQSNHVSGSGGAFQAPGYLPPSHGITSGQVGQQTTVSSSHGSSSGGAFQAPGYLPPSHGITSGQVSQQTTSSSGKSYSAPGYLPPGYDFQKNPESTQGVQQASGQGVVTHLHQISGQSVAHNIQQSSGQSAGHTHSQQATISFSGQGQKGGGVQEAFKGPGYLPPSGGASLKSNGFLTHISNLANTGVSTGAIAAAHQSFQGPGYLPPSSRSSVISVSPATLGISTFTQSSSYRAPGYLPPVGATHMHPLSSYMTSVQPFERYGSARKPFPVYGPPPSPHIPAIAPMYKEPASRPQHYAPAMSYAQNAISAQAFHSYSQQSYATSALNQQARQALQTFMPKDIRQSIATVPRINVASAGISTSSTTGYTSSSSSSSSSSAQATGTKVQTSAPASAKIRTVQIVNPTQVKTLKVLESLDHAGVKTIKILGPSNEEPKGDHRVVKVVSGHEQNVQTVKIFNDQQDVPTTEVAAVIAGSGGQSSTNNRYLPPRRKRNPKNVSQRKSRRGRTTGN